LGYSSSWFDSLDISPAVNKLSPEAFDATSVEIFRMIEPRRERLSGAMKELQVDHVLLTSLASIRYFTGYAAGIETGPSPFSPLMGALLWIAGEQPRLFLADMESSESVVPEVEMLGAHLPA